MLLSERCDRDRAGIPCEWAQPLRHDGARANVPGHRRKGPARAGTLTTKGAPTRTVRQGWESQCSRLGAFDRQQGARNRWIVDTFRKASGQKVSVSKAGINGVRRRVCAVLSLRLGLSLSLGLIHQCGPSGEFRFSVRHGGRRRRSFVKQRPDRLRIAFMRIRQRRRPLVLVRATGRLGSGRSSDAFWQIFHGNPNVQYRRQE